jgi:hypothetical protein
VAAAAAVTWVAAEEKAALAEAAEDASNLLAA